jgi:hypothetical protein
MCISIRAFLDMYFPLHTRSTTRNGDHNQRGRIQKADKFVNVAAKTRFCKEKDGVSLDKGSFMYALNDKEGRRAMT